MLSHIANFIFSTFIFFYLSPDKSDIVKPSIKFCLSSILTACSRHYHRQPAFAVNNRLQENGAIGIRRAAVPPHRSLGTEPSLRSNVKFDITSCFSSCPVRVQCCTPQLPRQNSALAIYPSPPPPPPPRFLGQASPPLDTLNFVYLGDAATNAIVFR
ncbi:hypothetical protein EJ06DRAFT_526503 [Trichodelitschia bisporula]|uniref:Uncharacterized protein n=1 Tax=Trichodelitschia bisporula TaxID=703511 RepID=A0A6G1I8V9_9PEZI|nr:hypothetical protein EJ06DRAFT_526503 [Trichodelitschia bisporula]